MTPLAFLYTAALLGARRLRPCPAEVRAWLEALWCELGCPAYPCTAPWVQR